MSLHQNQRQDSLQALDFEEFYNLILNLMESLEFGRWFIIMHEFFWKRNWEIDTWSMKYTV